MGKNQIDIKVIEEKWREYWEKEKIYKFNPKTKKKIFSVDTPPPTVSGDMHVGHASSYSHDDFIVRYKRMKGFEVLYPFGTDDNGLPTERLVERLKNVKSKNMSRAEFIELCLKTLKEITPVFVQDWKNLAISCDYDVYYSTIDDHSRKLSQKSFIELYKKGMIYKENFPTIYCPECQTPVAQAELEDKNKETFFTTMRFLTEEGNDLPIATTRPELLGACVAVFVNPNDERFKEQIGRKARVPLFEHEVPIIADKSAQMDKGTGVLMVCSYGDKYDVDAIKRYKLEPRIVFGLEGRVKEGKYAGLTILESRKKILQELREKDLIIEQKSITHAFNVHDKCGTGIEFLPTEQWFIRILDKKKELIEQGRKIKWHPAHMQKRYENWINGLEWDWSISRERHFGIPIPAWHCECGEIILADEKELPVDPMQKQKKCPKCGKSARPDIKVLDTWATSSLTPQIVSELLKGKVEIPYSLRPQAHDIIRTWVFYTIVKSLYHEKKVPWKEIAISGFVTLGGEKMAKSKGNVVSPRAIMDKFGSDATRYWAASTKLGDDIDYQENDLIAGKKFVTKLLNASRFVFMNLKHQDKTPRLIESDRLFLTQVNKLIQTASEAFEDYNYARAKLEAERFFWGIFADNYLEIVKGRVYNGSEEEKASAFYTLYQGLLAVVKLMAPITPYITEEVYQNHFKEFEKEKSVHVSGWPEEIKVERRKNDDKVWNDFLNLIAKIRQVKSENKKAMNSKIVLTLTQREQDELKNVMRDFKSVMNIVELKSGEFKVEFVE